MLINLKIFGRDNVIELTSNRQAWHTCVQRPHSSSVVVPRKPQISAPTIATPNRFMARMPGMDSASDWKVEKLSPASGERDGNKFHDRNSKFESSKNCAKRKSI